MHFRSIFNHFHIATIIVVIILIPILSHAETRNVPEEFNTIQAAINASGEGDTVLVQPGVYDENLTFDETSVCVGSLILTTSEVAYIDSTIISGERNASVVRFNPAELANSTLTGFSLRGGRGSADLDGDSGGGGVHCLWSSPTLTHLDIYGNEAEYGGGIFLQHSCPLIEFVKIFDNEARQSGGGIVCSREGTSPVIRNVKIFDNHAGGFGGGIASWAGAIPLLEFSEIYNNTSELSGGGVFCSQQNTGFIINNTMVYRNIADRDGGGFYFWDATWSVLDHVTIAYNQALRRGGAVASNSNTPNELHIDNSILYGNVPHQVSLCNISGADTLQVNHSDVSSGREGILVDEEADLVWGEGNIGEDPVFANVSADDFRLAVGSPCIDAGNPDFPADLDGSRTDMGAVAFEGATLRGFVFDAEDSTAVHDALITTSNGYSTRTDNNGFWSIAFQRGEFDVRAHSSGFTDLIILDLEIAPLEVLEIEFYLDHSVITPSIEGFSAELRPDETVDINFEIQNTGNRLLSWTANPVSGSEDEFDPWSMRISNEVGNQVEDNRLEGVVYADGRFYISGSNDGDPQIYVLNSDGEMIDRYAQRTWLGTNMNALAWDGELIWGSVFGHGIYGFRPNGEIIVSFDSPVENNMTIAMAYDFDNDLLLVAGAFTPIYAIDREGNVHSETPGVNNFYGLAYISDDADGCQYYILSIGGGGLSSVYKLNPESREYHLVTHLMPEEEGTPMGIFISNQFDLYNEVFINITSVPEDQGGDRLDIRQIQPDLAWIDIAPDAGALAPDETEEFTLSLNAANREQGEYSADIVITDTGSGGNVRLPVELRVTDPDVVDNPEGSLPIDFEISSVYPNPFNSTTKINYSLPFDSKVLMKLFNIAGQLVETLVEGQQRAGIYSTNLKADNLASGLYFVRLEGAGQVFTRKVMLVR